MGNKEFALQGMTGFARATATSAGVSLEIELKSVNSRYLDLVFKLPREYFGFEAKLREKIAGKLQRGRVEISVTRSSSVASAMGVKFNRGLFDLGFKSGAELLGAVGLDSHEQRAALVRDLMQRREIMEFVEGNVDLSKEEGLLEQVSSQAVQALIEMRKVEGQKLAQDCANRLAEMRTLKRKITECSAVSVQAAKKRLEERVSRLSPELKIDPLRLSMEVALLADRCDVTEELTRLDLHFEQFELNLTVASSGRKLDFLLQELGREFNTIASKCQDAQIQGLVVDAKAAMEKIREQVQNVE